MRTVIKSPATFASPHIRPIALSSLQMADDKKRAEAGDGEVHRIRITLSSRDYKALEKGTIAWRPEPRSCAWTRRRVVA